MTEPTDMAEADDTASWSARPGPDITAFASTGRRALTEVTRRLVDAVLTAEHADETDLLAAAVRIGAEVAAITGVPDAPPGRRTRMERSYADYLPRSPVLGDMHPVAPPFTAHWDDATRVFTATGVLGAPYEGPPGFAHGGIIALLFDEVLGMGNIAAGKPGMTTTLTVRYRRPTLLFAPVTLTARITADDDRRIHAAARLEVGGEITAEAEGSFAPVTTARAAEYFGGPAAPFDEVSDRG